MLSQIRRCYISAPGSVDTTFLRAYLRAREIRVSLPSDDDLSSGETSIVPPSLREADLVIGVITRERKSDFVLFELGQASALQKAVVLFSASTRNIIGPLRHILTLNASMSNKEAVKFALDQILAAGPDRPVISQTSSSARDTGRRLNSGQVEQLLQMRGHDLENGLATALRDANPGMLVKIAEQSEAADFVVWLDELQSSIGNPILVEVNDNIKDRSQLISTSKRLSDAISFSGAQWGVLLCKDLPAARSYRYLAPQNVIIMSIKDLLDRMLRQSFGDIIREERIQRVHGWR